MTDSYVYLITALLPLAASMVVVQVNPYHALIIRGILGAVAALVYAVLGAADVALTEALVGTMLAITLYAVAVRSSLVMRLGILTSDLPEPLSSTPANTNLSQASQAFNHLLTDLRAVLAKHYMRLELVSFTDAQSLQQALADKDIHATCVASRSQQDPLDPDSTPL
jgi:putative multicomponent Na+:H+ antiporter subunit B